MRRPGARHHVSSARVPPRLSARLGSPDDVVDNKLFRHDFQLVELVGQPLLIGNGGVCDRRNAAEVGSWPGQCYARHLGGYAGDLRQRCDGLVEVTLRGNTDLAQLIDRIGDDLRVGLGEIAIGNEKTVAVDDPARRRENARVRVTLDDGQIGIPDRPGIDGACLEGRSRVGRGKIDGLDVAWRKPALAQRLDGNIMRARATLKCRFLPFRSANERIGESLWTTMAEASGLPT